MYARLFIAVLFIISKILKYAYATYKAILKKMIINYEIFVLIKYYNLKIMKTF